MNWDDVQAFRAVADQRSFTLAATQLRVTRQALSKRVARLERAVRVPLFTRTTRRVELTDAGKHLLAAVKEMSEVWNEALTTIARDLDDNSHLPQPIRLAAFSLAIPMLLEAMSTTIPEASWATVPYDAECSLQELREGKLDLVFGFASPRSELPSFGEMANQLILTEPIWLAVAEGHPLTARAEVDLDDLAGEVWVSRPSGPLRTLLFDACETAGFTPHIVHLAEDNHAIRALVCAGEAITLSAPGVPAAEGLAVIPLKNAPRRPCFAAWKPSSIHKPFIEPILDGLHKWYLLTAQQNPHYWTYLRSHPEVFAQARGRQLLRAALSVSNPNKRS